MSPEARLYLLSLTHYYTLAGDTARSALAQWFLRNQREPYRTSCDRWLWKSDIDVDPSWRFELPREMIPRADELSCPSMDSAYRAVIDHYASTHTDPSMPQSPM